MAEDMERIRELQQEINRRRAPHRRDCSVNDPAYAGGPCSCGLVDPSNNDPLESATITPLPPSSEADRG